VKFWVRIRKSAARIMSIMIAVIIEQGIYQTEQSNRVDLRVQIERIIREDCPSQT